MNNPRISFVLYLSVLNRIFDLVSGAVTGSHGRIKST